MIRPLIQPWTMSPAAAGLETIHTMIRTATMMPMILDNNGLASRSGSAAAQVSRPDVPGKLPDQKLTNQSSRRPEPQTADSARSPVRNGHELANVPAIATKSASNTRHMSTSVDGGLQFDQGLRRLRRAPTVDG